jgi:hypothetical protein
MEMRVARARQMSVAMTLAMQVPLNSPARRGGRSPGKGCSHHHVYRFRYLEVVTLASHGSIVSSMVSSHCSMV